MEFGDGSVTRKSSSLVTNGCTTAAGMGGLNRDSIVNVN